MKRATVIVAASAILLVLGACTTMNVEVTEVGKVQATTASSALWNDTPAIKETHEAIDAACKASGFDRGIVGSSLPPTTNGPQPLYEGVVEFENAAKAVGKMLDVIERMVGMLPEHSYIWFGRCGPKISTENDEAICLSSKLLTKCTREGQVYNPLRFRARLGR